MKTRTKRNQQLNKSLGLSPIANNFDYKNKPWTLYLRFGFIRDPRNVLKYRSPSYYNPLLFADKKPANYEEYLYWKYFFFFSTLICDSFSFEKCCLLDTLDFVACKIGLLQQTFTDLF
jgi:hypothetical protein